MVSIIVPIYQVEEYLEECMNSILEQTYKDIEVICVNDCTMDNSITIVKEYQKRDNRIRIINHIENCGLGGARNTGIKAAKGEYILFIDSDDFIDKTMVEKMYNLIIEKGADVSVCGMMLFSETDRLPHSTFHYDKLANKEFYSLLNGKEILTDMWPSAVNKLFDLRLIRENNLLFKEKILYEDHTFFYEYFMLCNNFAYISEPLYFYRKQRPLSITSGVTGREKEIFQILEYIYSIFDTNFNENISSKLKAKIAVRLLYERRWVFNVHEQSYYEYLYAASEYLRKNDKNFLLKNKDIFIEDNDPLFYTANQIKKMQKHNVQKSSKNKILCFRIKNFIKRLPLIRKYFRFKSKLNDIWWLLWDNKKCLDSLKLNEERNDKRIKKVEENSMVFNELFDNRIYDLELKNNYLKQKSDDSWWVLWNIKDRIDLLCADTKVDKDSDFLKYYPTWLPCHYPEYFKGNTWYWSDGFKEYYLNYNEVCEEQLNNLKANLDEASKELVDNLWERNINMLPYSKYTDQHGILLKRDMVFSKEELEEQDRIFTSYNNIIHKYILPEGSIYEIPVFYYEHGLKRMRASELSYINEGDILDLGAFIGDSALVLSKYTKRTVYSVEMDGKNIKRMKDTLQLNNISDKIKVVNCGIGEKNGIFTYYGESSYSTLNNVNINPDMYPENVSIEVKNIDTLINEYNIEPHFIKIDIEGMELESIRGAQKCISKYKPILCISLYHTAKDFLLIKPLIESWELDYTFRVENHNPFDPVYEKMLIAIPRIFEA